jgi:hypothetical protein
MLKHHFPPHKSSVLISTKSCCVIVNLRRITALKSSIGICGTREILFGLYLKAQKEQNHIYNDAEQSINARSKKIKHNLLLFPL